MIPRLAEVSSWDESKRRQAVIVATTVEDARDHVTVKCGCCQEVGFYPVLSWALSDAVKHINKRHQRQKPVNP